MQLCAGDAVGAGNARAARGRCRVGDRGRRGMVRVAPGVAMDFLRAVLGVVKRA